MGLESLHLGELVQSKSEAEIYPNPENLILKPEGVGLLPPCSGPACPSAHEPY